LIIKLIGILPITENFGHIILIISISYIKKISQEQGLVLINDFIAQQNNIKTAFEPYPISLRGINWIKFFIKENIDNDIYNTSLYAQYQILLKNLEYQHLANHLIENGFSLLFGAYFFNDKNLYKKAKQYCKSN